MSKYKPQHSRLLFIDRKIREGGYPSCRSMAEEWEVARKTIQRDISYLKYQLDAPIEYVALQRGYHYTEKRYTLPAMDVREGDLFAIYLAEKLLAQYKGTPLHDNLATVFAKIAGSLPEKVELPSGQDFSKFTFMTEPASRLEEGVWQQVFDGVKHQETLRFRYSSPFQRDRSERSFNLRKLDPYHAVRHGGDWYVMGLCHTHDEVRTFNLSRMSKTTATGDFFVVPKNFDSKALAESQFGIYQGGATCVVEVVFAAKVAGLIREKKWHESQVLEPLGNGDLLMRLQVNHRLELKKWLLGWGADATVLRPDAFVHEMRNEVEMMRKKYSDNLSFA